MKISYKWLKDYLQFDLSAEEVGAVLTNIGLEVDEIEQVESIPGGLAGLVIGEVKTKEKHPDADKLNITTVDVGADELLQIVCGAPNVDAGQKVVVARVNTTIYPTDGDPFKIKKAKIRGVESKGMICAEDEIGLGHGHDGIMVLDSKATVGTAAKIFFNVEDDFVFDIGLTPNRADAMSHIGVVRDLVAWMSINDKKFTLNYPSVEGFVEGGSDPFQVEVKNTEDCPRYAGLLLENIEVKASPEWMQKRLQSVGVRPINNIVDITNFVLHEMGQPLHAFDAEKVEGQRIVVQNLASNSKFVTLDEEERSLNEADLMICNAQDGMCIAGVFGGLSSGVTNSTTEIFLESAYFKPTSIRRTALRHNLRTDAAMRFEKGIDPNLAVEALKRAALLMCEYAGATIKSSIVDEYPAPVAPSTVMLKWAYLKDVAGFEIPNGDVVKIMAGLGIEPIEETAEGIHWSVPTYKTDVTRAIDLVEEVLRIYDINKVPLQSGFNVTMSSFLDQKVLDKQAKLTEWLTGEGYRESLTLSLTHSKHYELLDTAKEGLVPLKNSISSELDVMRSTMLFSGMQVLQHNVNHRNLDVKIFEFGRTYHKEGTEISEVEHLAFWTTGNKANPTWKDSGTQQDFYDIKSAVSGSMMKLGLGGFAFKPAEQEGLSIALGLHFQGKQVGVLGKVNQKIAKSFDVKSDVFYADLDWTAVKKAVSRAKVKFEPLPKFPGMRRDLALVLNKDIPYSAVETIAIKTGKRLLKDTGLFDIYEDEKLGEDKKSYAISFLFQDPSKTLTDKEVDKVMDKLIATYEKELGAVIRK